MSIFTQFVNLASFGTVGAQLGTKLKSLEHRWGTVTVGAHLGQKSDFGHSWDGTVNVNIS